MYNLINNIYNSLLNKYYGIKAKPVIDDFNKWFINNTIGLHDEETQCLIKEKFNISNKEKSKWLSE